MTDDADRMAELERENVQLRAEIARLKPPPPEPARLDGPFKLPDARQMATLIKAVQFRYPVLRDNRIDDAELLAMVTSGFKFLSTLPRTPGKLDLRHDLMSWHTYAADAFRAIGRSCTLRGPALVIAAVASGDIPYLPPRLFPSCGFGVCLVGITRDTRPPTNSWLRVLEHHFNELLIIEPPSAPSFHPVNRAFDLTAPQPPMNLAPKTAWRDGM